MVEQTKRAVAGPEGRKRKNRFKKKRVGAKQMKHVPEMKKAKVSDKMKKIFHRRAKEYNSDSDEGEESEHESMDDEMEDERNDNSVKNEGGAEPASGEGSEEDDYYIQSGAMRFVEGCDAFRRAFKKIMKGHTDDESLGPVLSAHKKLVVSKLAEEEVEKKVKKENRKKRLEISEMGHVKPANFLDTHDKVLIGIATKGVVKFFNAVNKAQHAKKGLDPKRFKDAKALTKRRKEAFMAELSRADSTTKASMSTGEDNKQPGWAPLQDSFMLTDSKLKNWDKMEERESEMEI